ncbi:hypothetical protein N7462_008177 [Penicillium macrosclerotiorum]|uniref:uncharacterized protein n=1 Tax=Penicillium macrosclerotiorum TaxID=303699 RepID=UPI002547DE0A|nr:uncharacterized protein N7462_008177 [Penicillium macrosclerotiorum]KAJ5679933.1 hypothetical protein N7462_008177 [Penicillium macrosclerotiorum]
MSTGVPPSNAEFGHAPGTTNGHALGHSRGRGHNRSARFAQPPPPLFARSLNTDLAQEPESTDPTNINNSSDNTTRSSLSHHHHSGSSHSIAHHHHAKSVSSIHHDVSHSHSHSHSHAHAHDLTAESPIHVDENPERVQELLAGALIAFPWIVISWYPQNCARAEISGTEVCTSTAFTDQMGWKTCTLTAMTLLIFGCAQLIRMNNQQARPMTDIFSIKFPTPNLKTVKSAVLQICSIGLPIYASLKLGGFLVVFTLLLVSATGIPSLVNGNSHSRTSDRYRKKTLTMALIGAVVLLSLLGMNQPWDSSPHFGYLALLLSTFVLSPPLPSLHHQGPIPEPGLVAESISKQNTVKGSSQFSSIVTTDAPLALVNGISLACLVLVFSRGLPFSISELFFLLVPAGLFALSLMFALDSGLRSPNKVGLAACTGAAALFCSPHTGDDLLVAYTIRGILTAASFFAARMDDSHLRLDSHPYSHGHQHHHGHSHGTSETSRVTKWLIQRSEAYPLISSILKEKDSRSIFYFMCLNFTFMLVQLSYGFLTGSLGLLSDSIHMFFDCLALIVGLCAAVMSKWPPNARFPYGYGKVDTLSGFANGIFLMIISVEIIYEAVERLSSGSQMHRIGELLAVSIAGLLVNLVGIFSFEHGHHHHGHDHGHDHSHGNENMHGIFLHILADTLGSVAVVISTILVHYSGWSGYDPLASCFIAILIFASAVPLVSSTAKTLLLTLPADTEYNVRETLAGVSTLRGVVTYTVPKFWLDDTSSFASEHGHDHDHSGHGCDHNHSHSHSEHGHHHNHNHADDHTHDHHDHDHSHEPKLQNVLGVIHVTASRGSDLEDVRQRTVNYLREKNMDIVVQVERDGDSRCWCSSGGKAS